MYTDTRTHIYIYIYNILYIVITVYILKCYFPDPSRNNMYCS